MSEKEEVLWRPRRRVSNLLLVTPGCTASARTRGPLHGAFTHSLSAPFRCKETVQSVRVLAHQIQWFSQNVLKQKDEPRCFRLANLQHTLEILTLERILFNFLPAMVLLYARAKSNEQENNLSELQPKATRSDTEHLSGASMPRTPLVRIKWRNEEANE